MRPIRYDMMACRKRLREQLWDRLNRNSLNRVSCCTREVKMEIGMVPFLFRGHLYDRIYDGQED